MKIATHTALLVSIVALATFCAPVSAQEADAEKITFDDHITPILRARCSSCHNPNKKNGDLDVTNYTALMIGGGSGEVIVPGDSLDSFFYGVITHEEAPEMPPNGKLADEQIELIKNWIDGGALENSGSVANIQPKVEMAVGEALMTRPEVVPMPGRIPLQPAITTSRPGAVTAMATSPWAPVVAIAAPGQVVLYDTSKTALIGIFPLPEENGSSTTATALRFSRNGSLLVAGVGRPGASGRVMIWDVGSGDLLSTIGDELDSILAVDISPDQSRVAIGGPSKLIKVLSTRDGSVIYEIKKHTEWVTALEFSPDGNYLATGDRNGGLHLWLADVGDVHQDLKGHTASITGISWRADAAAVASSSEDTTVRIWNAESGAEMKKWNAHGGGATAVQFARNGNLVTAGRDNHAKVFDQEGATLHTFEKMADVAVTARYCEESARVICADWDGNIKVINAVDAAVLGTLSPNPPDLETRLANSRSAAETAASELAPLEATLAELEQKIVAATNAKQTEQSNLAATTTRINELQPQIAAAQQQLAETEANRQQWTSDLAQQNQAMPLVKESHVKALEASNALPEDVELKSTADELSGKITQIEARIAELNQMVATSNETTSQTQATLTQLQAQLAEQQAAVTAMNQRIGELDQEFNQLSTVKTEHVQLVEAARQRVNRTNAAVQRWTQEISFHQTLTRLRTQLADAEQTVASRNQATAEAEQRVAAAQAELNAARQSRQEAQAAAEAVEQQILQLRQQ